MFDLVYSICDKGAHDSLPAMWRSFWQGHVVLECTVNLLYLMLQYLVEIDFSSS